MIIVIKKILHFLWQAQPHWLREKILTFLLMFLSQPVDANRPLRKGNIIISGLLGTTSGLGTSARCMLTLFKTDGLPALGSNASRLIFREDFDAGPLWPQSAEKGGIVIFHLNPNMLPLAARAIGHEQFSVRRMIGFWAWEIETIPKQWQRCLSTVDEVWVPSEFIADAFRKVAPQKPICVIPHFVDISAIPTISSAEPLHQFAGRPIVFFMYDVGSNHARKNPEGVIAAFKQAVPNDAEPVLVIKVNNATIWPEAISRLEHAIGDRSNIYIMTEKLTNQDMKNLIARANIVISLHRSEGFGLLMAEAMAAAKPVIATGWSGNVDFMPRACTMLIDYTLVSVVDPQHFYDRYDAQWAEPDINQAAEALRYLLNHPEECQRMGLAARAHIADTLSAQNIMARLPKSFWDAIE